MQRGLFNLYDFELDPFGEIDEVNHTSSDSFEEDDDKDFEEVANILNARKYHDPILELHAMLSDAPRVTAEEKPTKDTKKITRVFSPNVDSLDEPPGNDKLFFEERANLAQKQIKSKLLVIRNKVRDIYKEMKQQEMREKNFPQNANHTIYNNSFFVDYLLLEMAGIAKHNKDYVYFNNLHYHTLVICMVRFMNTYKKQGLDKCSQFSTIQLAFRNYLFEVIPMKDKIEEKEIKHISQSSISPLSTSSINEEPQSQLTILERLSKILSNIITHLTSLIDYFRKPCCLFFRSSHKKPEIEEDDGLDHKHTDDNSVRQSQFRIDSKSI